MRDCASGSKNSDDCRDLARSATKGATQFEATSSGGDQGELGALARSLLMGSATATQALEWPESYVPKGSRK